MVSSTWVSSPRLAPPTEQQPVASDSTAPSMAAFIMLITPKVASATTPARMLQAIHAFS